MKTDYDKNLPCLTIDIKRARIRIYRTTLHLLGEPRYFRMLVNPETKSIIMEKCEETSTGAYCFKEPSSKKHSFELFSPSLVHKITVCAGFGGYASVRLQGRRIHGQNAVFFRMESEHAHLSSIP